MVVANSNDERRHRTGAAEWWGETWGFEVHDEAVGLAAFVQLTVHPRRRSCWFVAAVRRPGEPYVLCRELDLGPPADPLEIRGAALWAHFICESPFDHWTVAMEAYAVALDPPEQAWHGERGTRVGLAFDLEWESTQTPIIDDSRGVSGNVSGNVSGYMLDCVVHGDLQVGDDRLNIAGVGTRSHQWGLLDPAWLTATWPPTAQPDERWAPWVADIGGQQLRLARRL